MPHQYWTKADVYREVDRIRRYYLIPEAPLSAFQVIRTCCKRPSFEIIDFPEPDVCAMMYKGQYRTVIGLNASHTKQQQNYYCSHEFMHYCWHGNQDQRYMCKTLPDSSERFIEWQANEGGAELLMPYRIFIPDIIEAFKYSDIVYDAYTYYDWQYKLADKYHVSPFVIEYRAEQLSYETMQYLANPAFDQIIFLSKTKQLQQGINVGLGDVRLAVQQRQERIEKISGVNMYFCDL